MGLLIIHRRRLALMVCLILLFGLLLSALFVTTHSHHRCAGAHCSVCRELRQAMGLITRIVWAGAGLLLLPHVRLRPERTAPPESGRFVPLSPVALGIRLNN